MTLRMSSGAAGIWQILSINDLQSPFCWTKNFRVDVPEKEPYTVKIHLQMHYYQPKGSKHKLIRLICRWNKLNCAFFTYNGRISPDHHCGEDICECILGQFG